MMRNQAGRFDPAELDRMFFALADATRRGMLEQLSRGSASVSELAGAYSMALPSVVKHLGVLEEGGLVSSSKTGRVRTYSITPTAFARMNEWVAAHKVHIEAQFDNLDAYLAKQTAKKMPNKAVRKQR
jgi:DNA-binding transcriptional ArsR family regulator